MAKRPSVTNVAAGGASTALNSNFQRIAAQFDNTLSRDGSVPNQMEADLDMNNNDILNLNTLRVTNLFVQNTELITPPEILAAVEEIRASVGEAEAFSGSAANSAATALGAAEEAVGVLEGAATQVALDAVSGELENLTAVVDENEEFAFNTYAPRIQKRGLLVPIATEGRTLYKTKRQIGKVKAGLSGAKVRWTTVGDSWSSLLPIPTAFVNLLGEAVTTSAGTYMAANTTSLGFWPGSTFAVSAGWSWSDASLTSNFPYGVGIDGHVYNTTNNTDTITITGIRGFNLTIYTRQWGGTWRYRVDGGSWVTVVEGSDGSLRSTSIGGLTDTTHSLDIDTTGNTGRVVFLGVRNTTLSNADINKMGNGGLTGARLRDYITGTGDMWANTNTDLVICNLGTNDYLSATSSPQDYLEGLQALTTTVKTALPDCGIVFIVPAQSNGTQITPLSEYRDAAYEHCLSTDCEMLNLLDMFGPYGDNMWTDSLHPNAAGSSMIARQMNHSFFTV